MNHWKQHTICLELKGHPIAKGPLSLQGRVVLDGDGSLEFQLVGGTWSVTDLDAVDESGVVAIGVALIFDPNAFNEKWRLEPPFL